MSVRDVTVLGSSAQVPTRYRNHNGYLVRWDGEGLLFDPGEGTQRQFIYAGIPPTVVRRIFITHFHGDHCLGLAGIFQRLSLDAVKDTIHIYFPASGQVFVERMRRCAIYHDRLSVELHPVREEGVIDVTEAFSIETYALDHTVETFGYRLREPDSRRFVKERLVELGLSGPIVGELEREGSVTANGRQFRYEDLSMPRKGLRFAFILDTRPCDGFLKLARNADFVITEGTFLSSESNKAAEYGHMTIAQAAGLAAEAGVSRLLLTHFSQRYTNVSALVTEARRHFPGALIARDLDRHSLK